MDLRDISPGVDPLASSQCCQQRTTRRSRYWGPKMPGPHDYIAQQTRQDNNRSALGLHLSIRAALEHVHAKLGRMWSSSGQSMPSSDKLSSNRAQIGRKCWPMSVELEPTLVDPEPMFVEVGRHRPKVGQSRHKIGQCWDKLAELGRAASRVHLARIRPNSTWMFGLVWVGLSGVDPIWASIGRHPESLHEPCSGTRAT